MFQKKIKSISIVFLNFLQITFLMLYLYSRRKCVCLLFRPIKSIITYLMLWILVNFFSWLLRCPIGHWIKKKNEILNGQTNDKNKNNRMRFSRKVRVRFRPVVMDTRARRYIIIIVFLNLRPRSKAFVLRPAATVAPTWWYCCCRRRPIYIPRVRAHVSTNWAEVVVTSTIVVVSAFFETILFRCFLSSFLFCTRFLYI